MLSTLTGHNLEAVRESTTALFQRAGVPSQSLTDHFDHIINEEPGEFELQGQRNLRRANAGYENGIKHTKGDSIGIDGDNSESSDRARLQRALNEVEITNELIRNIIADIDIEIGRLEEQIVVIDRQLEEVAQQREVVLAQVEEAVQQEEALDQAMINVRRAEMAIIAANSADAVISAHEDLETAKDNLRAASQDILGEGATLGDVELAQTVVQNSILELRAELRTLSGTEAELIEQRDSITADIEQLIESRRALNELDLENGEYTAEEVFSLIPDELETDFLNRLADNIEAGWEYTTETVSNLIDRGQEYASNLTAWFRRSHDGEELLTEEEQTYAAINTPAPALTPMNT
ncbi:MAG: hypothetical protein HRT94_00095 [Alphaproteobacteria bacterium]|nr:hypothetical protein [Alphaproteobacteria bacterium]